MRILCLWTDGGPASVRAGWGRVLQGLGHEFTFWDPRAASAFDIFARINPDVFIGTTYDLDDATEKCLRARPELRVALFASAWGPLLDGLPESEFPIVRARADEVARVARLRRDTGQPCFVFLHASGDYLHGAMSGWGTVGVPYLGVLNAADVYLYGRPRFNPDLFCDACFVGGKWPYKARKLEPYIYPLQGRVVRRPDYSGPLRLKVFGRNHWEFPCYLGPLSPRHEADLFASATLCLNVSEPHSTDPRWGGDIIERVFKVLCAGGRLVTDRVPEMDALFPANCYVAADDPADFHDLVVRHAGCPQSIQDCAVRGRQYVLDNHTYHHRVQKLMAGLGFPDEGEKSIQLLQRILGELPCRKRPL